MKATNLFDTSADYSTLSGFKADFKDGYKPFGTVGLKGVFNVSDSFGIGPFFQASLYSNYEDKTSGTESGSAVTQEMKIKRPQEINLGVGLQGKVSDVIIYGGPVVYWTKTTIEQKWREPSGNVNDTYTMSHKEKNNVGGFAGVRVPLTKGLSLEVEGQYKSEFSMGGAITYSF